MFFWFQNILQMYREEFPDVMKEVKEEFEALQKKKSKCPNEKVHKGDKQKTEKEPAPIVKKGKGISKKKAAASKVKLQIFFLENRVTMITELFSNTFI